MTDRKRIFSFIPSIIAVFLLIWVVSIRVQNEALEGQNRVLSQTHAQFKDTLKRVHEKMKDSFLTAQSIQKEKKAVENLLESLKTENGKLQDHWEAIKQEKIYLESALTKKLKTISLLKRRARRPSESMNSAAAPEDLAVQARVKDNQIKKLDEQNLILTEKLERLYQMTKNKLTEINVAKMALEETVSAAQAKIDEEWSTVDLGSIAMNTKGQSFPKERANGPKMGGRVLATNEEHGFVVINLGKMDHLTRDSLLEVINNGETVATLTILEIRDNMSACNVRTIEEGKKISINDAVKIEKD